MSNKEQTFGIFEVISIPELGINNALAKIDTGAYSGALHCSKIKELVENDKKFLEFTPFEDNLNIIKTDHYKTVFVRSSNGHRVKRYLFDTDIVIKGIVYKIRIGLSDRSDMNFEILIGRRFLRENNILVDVRINQDLDSDGEKRL